MTVALVAGSAACLWDDVVAARKLCKFDAVYCVKMTGIEWPDEFDVWVTLHPEYMAEYREQRRALGLPNGYQVVAPTIGELGRHGVHPVDRRVSYRWAGMNASASSGIYGAKVAMEDGHNVILAGVPMDDSNHFSRGAPWRQHGAFEIGFQNAVPFMRGRVRSMSGRTKEILGPPTPEWIAGN